MKILVTIVLLSISVFHLNAQVINGYAKVTTIAGATLTVSNVNEGGDTFEDDEWVILMQMQDDVIGTTTNTVGFGSLGSINSVGLHEIRQIDSHTESLGVPATVTLKNAPSLTYNTCANCSVQIITFPELGSPDYTTTAPMSALPWDGNVGGVLGFEVAGVLTLEHDIDLDGDGFRGAGTNGGGSTGCSGGSNYRVNTGVNHADKGEGIYKSTDATHDAGRARILTGGGGGNSHNAGGGGGGNYTGGGDGGPGWPTCSPSAGGIGGLDMSADITVGRIFLGGGGGAGEGNNGFATNGGNGGGIILIKATEIETGTCGGLSISANGEAVPGTGGNDGGGGGGAAGSIVFEVDTWSIAATCPLTISANGGNGGNVTSGATHGGGGGGAQGVIIFSTAAPGTNVTVEAINGDGGCNNSSVPCNSAAGSGTGSDGDGILDLLTGPLPVELLDFSANRIGAAVFIEWITKSELNNDFFLIERSSNGNDWGAVGTVDGSGNSAEEKVYNLWDRTPLYGISYYRLKQVDFDGDFAYSNIETIYYDGSGLRIFPNPAKNVLNLQGENIDIADIYMVNSLSQVIVPKVQQLNPTHSIIYLDDYSDGIYTLVVNRNNTIEQIKLIVLND